MSDAEAQRGDNSAGANQSAAPQPEAPSGIRSAWWAALRASVVATAIALILASSEEILDPFGLDTESDALSAIMFNTITSAFYGRSAEQQLEGERYASRFGQSNIVVLLIDDGYLKSSGKSWPLRPREYRNMLQKLVDADASAVFVDIYFRQENERRSRQIARLFRDTTCMQQESRCELSDPDWACGSSSPACAAPDAAAGTSIFFAGTLRNPVPTALDQEPPGAALAMMRSESNKYLLTDVVISDSEESNEAMTAEQRQDTAAWALYKAWCARSADCDAATLGDFPDEPMYLHWGFAPNRMLTDVEAFGAGVCQKQARTFMGRVAQSTYITGMNLVRGYADKQLAPCPYHTQIKAELFNQLTQAELRELFAGKVVLLGASLQNFPDYQWSPVHEYIPGVFWHAMALDNLMEFGSRYRQDSDSAVIGNLEVIGIFGILLIHWLLGGRIRGFEQLKENAADEDGTSVSMEREVALLDLLHALVTICLVAATVLWVTGVKSISPSNWIGFAMLMLLIDYKPFTSVGRFVRAQYPLERLEGRMFEHWRLRVLPPVATVMAVIVAYILFVLPHAALLGRYFPDEVVSQASLLVYTIIVIVCTVTIFKRTSP